MRYKPGDLVWITTSWKEDLFHSPPALILAAYIDEPTIWTHNEVENKRWIADEGLFTDWVYDIMWEGRVECGVASEWLRPLKSEEE